MTYDEKRFENTKNACSNMVENGKSTYTCSAPGNIDDGAAFVNEFEQKLRILLDAVLHVDLAARYR